MFKIEDKEKQAEKEITEQLQVEKKLKKVAEEKKVAGPKTKSKKKGQPVNFRPARRLPEVNAPDGFVAAWKENSPENVRKCLQEGWEVANRIDHKMDVDMGDYYKKLNDSPTDEKHSTIEHNELICMLLPEEVAEARREYYREETEKQTRAKLRPEDNPQNAAISQASNIQTRIEIE